MISVIVILAAFEYKHSQKKTIFKYSMRLHN